MSADHSTRALLWLLISIAAPCALAADSPWRGGPGYRTFVIGDERASRPAAVSGGWLLSGGGDWDYNAFRWFAERAGHGHIVVLRASGTTETQDELYRQVQGVLSVRSFVFNQRRGASDPRLLAAVRAADGLFIAGGDQSNYVRLWRGTPLNAVIDAHVAAGKPLGGTSAGLAVMGSWLYGAMDGGSITSPQALADPLGQAVTLESHFLHNGALSGLITDSHFDTRERLGRLIAFLAKARSLAPAQGLAGLGIDEEAVLTVESDGTARFHSRQPGKHAWLVQTGAQPEPRAGQPLEAVGVRVVGIDAESRFNVLTLKVQQPAFIRHYDVVHGALRQQLRWSLAIHGGAGIIDRAALTPALDLSYRDGLRAALNAGRAVLAKGGSALDAAQAAVTTLEDDPHFNAGRGAAIAADDHIYLDAAIMDGRLARAGAVAALTRTKNPILAARAVMQSTPHVLLAGPGADAFSLQQGLAQADPAYFRTPEREQMLREWQRTGAVTSDGAHRYGTVGAVALDVDGHLAAATSTGGLTGKQWGRIGDSPLIGAGTYARDGLCAVSATGTGEYFIRDSAARQVCDRVLWNHQNIAQAAYDTIMAVGAIGGDGGLIAMDGDGRVSFAINDLGMYRGAVSSENPMPEVAIYSEDPLR